MILCSRVYIWNIDSLLPRQTGAIEKRHVLIAERHGGSPKLKVSEELLNFYQASRQLLSCAFHFWLLTIVFIRIFYCYQELFLLYVACRNRERARENRWLYMIFSSSFFWLVTAVSFLLFDLFHIFLLILLIFVDLLFIWEIGDVGIMCVILLCWFCCLWKETMWVINFRFMMLHFL